MSLRTRTWNAYHFCVTIPDRIYPFASYIDGQKVRWRRSYEQRLALIQEQFGACHFGFRLSAYREVCHVLGALIFIGVATLLSHALLGSDAALPTMFIAAGLAITVQEFYIHPRHYNQLLRKGVIDWVSWVAPISIYFFFILN